MRASSRAPNACCAPARASLLDAVFARAEERAAAEALARKVGVPFEGLWLDVPKDVALARVANRKADASDATPAVVERQFGYELGRLTWRRQSTAES
jgi:predicted kinase